MARLSCNTLKKLRLDSGIHYCLCFSCLSSCFVRLSNPLLVFEIENQFWKVFERLKSIVLEVEWDIDWNQWAVVSSKLSEWVIEWVQNCCFLWFLAPFSIHFLLEPRKNYGREYFCSSLPHIIATPSSGLVHRQLRDIVWRLLTVITDVRNCVVVVVNVIILQI